MYSDLLAHRLLSLASLTKGFRSVVPDELMPLFDNVMQVTSGMGNVRLCLCLFAWFEPGTHWEHGDQDAVLLKYIPEHGRAVLMARTGVLPHLASSPAPLATALHTHFCCFRSIGGCDIWVAPIA